MTHQLEYHADHTLLLALPAFAPALVVVGVVVYIAMRDRRRGGLPENDGGGPPRGEVADSSSEDGSP